MGTERGISVKKLIELDEAIKVTWKDTGYTDPVNVMMAIRDRLEALPTVDAIRVVRCRNCRFSQRINEWVYECYVWNDDRMFNQYCDMGERKDGDDG